MPHKQVKASVKRMSRKQLLAFLAWLMLWLRTEKGMQRSFSTPKHRKHRGKKHGGKAAKRHRGRPPKGKVPPQLRPYLFKKGHGKVRKRKR
jgi:hypothetical protein